MRILGIDPGTYRLGVGLIDTNQDEMSFVESYLLTAPKADYLPDRLRVLYEGLIKIIEEWKPDEAAIEQPFVHLNARTAMMIGYVQAVAMLAAAQYHIPVQMYSPKEIKKSVTDYGNSSKEQVHEMVKVILDLEKLSDSLDVSDALAVTICHSREVQIRQLL